MADHTKFLALSRRLLAREGRSVTFSKLAVPTFDPEKPWRGAEDTAELVLEVTTVAVFLPHYGSDFGRGLIVDESFLKRSSESLLVAPPETGEDLEGYEFVTDASQRWKIEWIQTLKPADLTVLFAIGVSR